MKHPYFFCGLTFLWLASFLPASAQSLSELSAPNYEKEIQAHRKALDKEFRDPAHSPLPAKQIRRFKGLEYFPADIRYVVEATFAADSAAQPFFMKTTTTRLPEYRKYGELKFSLEGQVLTLSVYQSLELTKKGGYDDYLFIPFTDPTNGDESYGGGRYIDLRMDQLKQKPTRLDFNRAYNPYCAYSKGYSCPIPPAENRLPVAIRAGVKSPH
jgi:uncharacterized protein (DUF1684 family)